MNKMNELMGLVESEDKQKYKGIFNYHGELITLYASAYSKAQAKAYMIRQLNDKVDRGIGVLNIIYNGTKDNFRVDKVENK